jgi:hypothetical protein
MKKLLVVLFLLGVPSWSWGLDYKIKADTTTINANDLFRVLGRADIDSAQIDTLYGTVLMPNGSTLTQNGLLTGDTVRVDSLTMAKGKKAFIARLSNDSLNTDSLTLSPLGKFTAPAGTLIDVAAVTPDSLLGVIVAPNVVRFDSLSGDSATFTLLYGGTLLGDGSSITGIGASAPTTLTFTAKVNEAGGVTKGQPVYISGASGQTPQVSLTDNRSSTKREFAGLAAETKTNGQTILIRNRGELTGVDTDGTGTLGGSETWADGDAIYFTTAGRLTKTKPTGGFVQHVATVEYAHGTNGKLLVTTHNEPYVASAGGENVDLRMGDAAGTTKVAFEDSNDAVVAWVNSDGGAKFRLDTVFTAGTQPRVGYAYDFSAGKKVHIAHLKEDTTAVDSLTVRSKASFVGAIIADLGTVTTADINGGTIDGTTIGGASAAAGTFTTLTATGASNLGNGAGDSVNVTVYNHTNAINLKESTGATTSAHLGQFAGTTYFFNNYYFDGGHKANSSTLASSGMILSNSQTLGFYTAPANATPTTVLRASIDSVAFRGSYGTAALPSIAAISDPNTGVNWLGADSLEVVTNGTPRITVRSAGNVGIGATTPAYKLDVAENTTAVPALYAHNAHATGYGALIYGGSTVSQYGLKVLSYDGSTTLLHVGSGGSTLLGTATANAKQTLGLTINQGAADDEILSLKSSDVAHGMTDLTETDTYARLAKLSATAGGANWWGLSEATKSFQAVGLGATDDTGKLNSSTAYVTLGAGKTSGTTITSPGANANLVAIGDVASANGTKWLLDQEGDTWQSGGATIGGDVVASADSTYDLGTSTVAWKKIYSNFALVVGDMKHYDDRDDLALISAIKGSGTYDANGRELVDDASLPTEILAVYAEDRIDTTVSNIVMRTDTLRIDTTWVEKLVDDSTKVVSYTVALDDSGRAVDAEPVYDKVAVQEIEKIVPVTKTFVASADTALTVHQKGDLVLNSVGKPYIDLTASDGLLYGAIRQLMARDDSLQARIEALEATQVDILKRLEALEGR